MNTNSDLIRFISAFIWFALGLLLLQSCNAQSPQVNQRLNDLQPSKTKKIVLDKAFYTAFEDSKGILWFGTMGNGLYRYDGTHFTNFSKNNGLHNDYIFDIVEDKFGILWIGTGAGLSKHDGEKFEHIPIPFTDISTGWLKKVAHVIDPNAVHAIEFDDDGNLWIGTGGVGAYQYDGEKFTSYLVEIGHKQEDSLYHNWVTKIERDNEGNMWFGSMCHGGLSRFDGKEFNHYKMKEGLPDDQIRAIYTDKSGAIWVGFNGNKGPSITEIVDGVITNHEDLNGNFRGHVREFYQDSQGLLYFGGQLDKLMSFDGQTFVQVKSDNDEVIENVLFILGTENEDMWFGGDEGLWKYDGKKYYKMSE